VFLYTSLKTLLTYLKNFNVQLIILQSLAWLKASKAVYADLINYNILSTFLENLVYETDKSGRQ
jgi:hypothetical protein